MSPAETINLSSSATKVVFEYMFENIAESAFSIQLLIDATTRVNMQERYLVSATRLNVEDYRDSITETELAPQQLTEKNARVYIYVMAEIENVNKNASYEAEFTWVLLNQNTVEVTLNDGASTRTLKVIPTTVVENIAMPVVTSPTVSDLTKMFA